MQTGRKKKDVTVIKVISFNSQRNIDTLPILSIVLKPSIVLLTDHNVLEDKVKKKKNQTSVSSVPLNG